MKITKTNKILKGEKGTGTLSGQRRQLVVILIMAKTCISA